MKRLTVAAIIAVMTAGIFTGCGNAGTAQMNSATGNAAEGQNTQNSTETNVQSGTQSTGEKTDNSNNGSSEIGEDAALKAALDAAGVSEDEASRIRVSLDRDDGKTVYDVKFDVGETEYDYEILASDGKILTAETERNDDNDSSDNTADVAISRDKAIKIALAKVPGAAAKDIRIELDRDDGRYKYEGDIIYERTEYDFEIDAESGDVLEWSEERD